MYSKSDELKDTLVLTYNMYVYIYIYIYIVCEKYEEDAHNYGTCGAGAYTTPPPEANALLVMTARRLKREVRCSQPGRCGLCS